MTADDAAGRAIVPVGAPASPAGGDAFYDATGKSPQEIEEDIEDTRTQLGDILDELERQLAPRHLLEKGVDMLKETMTGKTGRIGEAVRNNPVPLALIGLGVGWMVLSTTGGTRKLGEVGGELGARASETMRGMGRRAGELAGQVKGRVLGASEAAYPTQGAGEPMAGYAYARPKPDQSLRDAAQSPAARAAGAVNDAARRAREAADVGTGRLRDTMRRVQEAGGRAGDYAQYAGDRLVTARDRAADLMAQHPLTVGALAFLAGTVAALLLPRTRAEERWVAPVGEQLREQAEQVGRQAIQRAQEVAERAADAVVDVVKEAASEATAAASGKPEHEAAKSEAATGTH